MKIKLLLFLFLISSLLYSQKRINTKQIKGLLTDSLYSGKVILLEHLSGKLQLRHSKYLEKQEYNISDINFHKNSIGDFNKNGVIDVFATMQIKRRTRNELYICLVELDDNILTIYSYFEMGTYSKLTIKSVKNDTLKIRTEMWGINKEPYLDREVSIVHDKQEIVRIVTPNRLNKMKNTDIFKKKLKNIQRASFINNRIIKTQNEEYKKDNLLISAELSGFNDFSLRFIIYKKKIKKDFNEIDFIYEIFEFLESNTRFPTILTRIEKIVFIKNEEKLAISNNLKYNIKNYINSNTYFILEQKKYDNYFLFDLLYYD